MAMFNNRRREHQRCIRDCTELLDSHPRDQAALYLKCSAFLQQSWVDDTNLEDQGTADLLLDANTVAAMPRYLSLSSSQIIRSTTFRPGTSLNRPASRSRSSSEQSLRPVSNCGRPLTGFERPGTTSRPITGREGLEAALRTTNTATGQSRPVTSLGHELRLGTASLLAESKNSFLDISRLDFSRLVRRESMSKVICDYLIYHEHNPRRALELCAEATREANFKDWWWKARLGRCYYRLGLYRDAEKQLSSSLQDQNMAETVLELSKVYIRLDQPNAALAVLEKANKQTTGETRLMLGIARIHEMLYAIEPSVSSYKMVLAFDASNVEGLSSLAANHFYSYQPEISLRYYRRLLQMGVVGPEIWNNVGLCCFFSSQFDLALNCFGRALQLADDIADIWYNIGHIGIGIGNCDLAYQSFKVALSVDGEHAESLCNLGVLELQSRNTEAAQAIFNGAQSKAPHLFQPFFNGALLAYKLGNIQDSFSMVRLTS